MSKTLKPGDRKGIIITNDAPMNVYGGVRGPITSMYYETIEKIGAILSDQVKVAQVTSKGEKIALDFTNFDKDLDPYDDEVDEVLELITCIPDKIIDLEIEKTINITTDVEACSFESLNAQIASVSEDGLVTAIKVGETAIRVSKEGYRTVSIPISVVDKPIVTCTPSQVSGLIVGQTIQLTATPDNATFTSESDEIATVTPEGLVTSISQGKTKIIVSAEGYRSTEVVVMTQNKPIIKCNPESIEGLYVGETSTITTEPTGASFRSEDQAYATVTEEGVVTGVKAGTTNIIVSKEGYQDATVSVSLRDKLDIDAIPEMIYELFVGEQTTIITDPNVVEFTSEEPRFATVSDKGVVRGISEGSTNILITKEGYNDLRVPVTVKDKASVKCTPSEITTLYVNEKQQITTVPTGASFSSENDQYATVSPDGTVTGVAEGTTNIIVSKVGYKDTKVKVTVKEKGTILCTPESVDGLIIGKTQQITTEPTGASFRSENDQYATVTQDGTVTGVAEGTTNIIITKEGYKDATVKVTVQKGTIVCDPLEIATLYVEDEQQITTEPTGASFRSEDDQYATVTGEGLVKGIKAGNTNIIVSKEGYNDATVKVTVKEKGTITCHPQTIESLKVGSIESILTDPFEVTFRSENEEYATVTEAGVVTGVAEGTTNIIITKEGYKDTSVAVTVVAK